MIGSSSRNQQGCPGDAELRVSVFNPSNAGVAGPTRVYFYDGNPEAGGVVISSGVTQGTVPANQSTEVTARWPAPGPGAHEVFALALGANRAVSRAMMVCVPQPENGLHAIRLDPTAAAGSIGTPRTVNATVKDVFGQPIPGVPITFEATGANTASGFATTNTSGTAAFTYAGTHTGHDTIAASWPTSAGTSRAGTFNRRA